MIDGTAPLHSASWLPALGKLQLLDLRAFGGKLNLPLGLSAKLTALTDASLRGIITAPALPASALSLIDTRQAEPPPQVCEEERLLACLCPHRDCIVIPSYLNLSFS